MTRFGLVAVALLGACSGEVPDGPHPRSVTPASGPNHQDTPIEIIGERFFARVQANFDDEEQTKADTTFLARLGSHALEKVTFLGSTKLTVVVPKGLPPGTYPLTVVDPRGNSGTLDDAFTVLGRIDSGPVDGGVDGPPSDLPPPDQQTPDGPLDGAPDQALDQSPDLPPDLPTTDLPTTDTDLPLVDAPLTDQAVPDLPLPPDLPPDQMVPDQMLPDQMLPDLPSPDAPQGPLGGMAVWRESGSNIPFYNLWNGGFGTATLSMQTGSFRIMAGAEAPTRTEVIVVGVDNLGLIYGQRWDGASWKGLANPLNANQVSETYWWGMDVAYEQQSGDAMVVWNNAQAGHYLRYTVWNGSAWTAKTTVTAYAGGEPQQMRLVARPGTDEMLLVVNDINADDYALVWNGSSWGNALLLDSSGNAEKDQTALDATYEAQRGQGIVVYGKNASPNVFVRLLKLGVWGSVIPIQAPFGVTAQARWLRVAAAPGGNSVALAVLTTGGTGADVWLAVWDGSGWSSTILAETNAVGSTFPNVAVAFESVSGQALAVYGEDNQTSCRFRTWSPGGGWSSEQSTPKIGGKPNSLTLSSNPDSDQIMLSVQDDKMHLNYMLWNGSSWGLPSEQTKNTGETKNQPFLFLWNR